MTTLVSGRSKATKGNGSYGEFSSWIYRFKVVIKASAFSSAETDWTAFIDHNVWSSDAWQYMESSGGDIRASSDLQGENRLSIGLIAIDTGSENLSLMVGPINTSSVVDVPIYFFVGKVGAAQPAAASTGGREGCFDTSYAGMWPAQESDGISDMVDYTGANNNGSPNGTINNKSGGPIYGDAIDFSGTGGYFDFGTPADLRFTKEHTLECWINPDPPMDDYGGVLVNIFDTGATESGYGFFHDEFYGLNNGFSYNIFTADSRAFTGGTKSSSGFGYFQMYYDGTDIYLRKDGNQIDTDGATGDMDWTPLPLELDFGRYFDDNEDERFLGGLQQVKFHSTDRSVNWLNAVYENEEDSTTVIELKPFVT